MQHHHVLGTKVHCRRLPFTSPGARRPPPAPAPCAAARTAATSLDVGNVVALEHINLEVPDLEVG